MDQQPMTSSNLSKIKPKLRTEGRVTGNFGHNKVKGAHNSSLGFTKAQTVHITTQDEYLHRLYIALDTAPLERTRIFCYNEIKRILIQRGLW